MNADSKFDIRSGAIRIAASATRGATGTIRPIVNGVVIRMGSGRKRDMTRHGQRLFEGTIRTADIWPLPLSGTWLGTELDIDYPGELVEPIGIPQQRPAVPGTLRFHDAQRNVVPEAQAVERVYCPQLHIIMTTPWNQEDDDWAASATSAIDWEEQPA